MTRLESLSVRDFRGIVDSCLPFDGGSIILGGGNGTGKTAFVDALEFLFTGSAGSLAGIGGLSLRHHGAHLHASPGSTIVAATVTAPHGTIRRSLAGPMDVPALLEPFLAQANNVSFVLRRAQLQEFIHARPADRYRRLADLIGADELDRTESALKRARDTLDRSLHEAEAAAERLERRLAEIPDDVPEEDILAEVNDGLAELGLRDYNVAAVEDLGRVRTAIVRSVSRREPDPQEQARFRLRSELERGIGVDHLLEVVGAYRTLLPARNARATPAELLDLLQVLQRGRDYLRQTEDHHCPLCEQDVEPRALLNRLVQRVSQLEEISLQQQRLDRTRADLQVALQDIAARLRAVERAQNEAGLAGRATTGLSNAATMVSESLQNGAATEQLEMTARLEDACQRWLEWRADTLASMPETSEDEDDSPNAADRALSLLQYAAAQLAQGSRGREERDRITGDLAELGAAVAQRRRALGLARIAFSTFNRVKNEQIQQVFDDLQTDLVRFYDRLHPGEGHSALAIAMDPRKRGSSDLRMGFYDRPAEDPRAYGSEGHLDSLGLCIFLAFARRFNGDWPLLVLDDVVTSVDAAHKRRIATLLLEEFADRQLFITTQDSRWFSDLQRIAAEVAPGRSRAFVIEGWSLDEGPKLREMS